MTVRAAVEQNMAQGQGTFTSSWRERLTALKNLPPVLNIVWRSGRGVVTAGLVLRVFTSLQPIALLAVGKFIIDNIYQVLAKHQPVPNRLWWLVAAEFAIAVLGNILTRATDYTDSLLADKYTRHVGIEVMRHAAQLDLIAYEDPLFYDRLERARVQATDRLAMIQMLGRLIQQVLTTITLSVSIIYFFRGCCCCSSPVCCRRLSGKPISRFWDTPRTSARPRPSGNWITCECWAAARKQPRS